MCINKINGLSSLVITIICELNIKTIMDPGAKKISPYTCDQHIYSYAGELDSADTEIIYMYNVC